MILIKNGYVKTMAGDDIDGGAVLIDDNGKISAVGKDIEAPAGCTVIDAEGRLVTPGCVEGHSHVGMHEAGIGREGADVNESSDPITPQMRGIDGFCPQDENIAEAVACGVTTACAGPGSANVVGGTFAAYKLYGDRVDDMIIKNPVAMKCAFGENPRRVYGDNKKAPITRMAVAALLRELIFKTKRYLQDKEAGKNPAFDMKLEAMIPVIKGEIPLKAHAHRADDIFTAIRIAKEFDLKLTIDHCTSGSKIAEHLAKEGYPVFVGPSFGNKSKIELEDKSFETPRDMAAAGVPFAITTDSPVTPLARLPLCAGFAVSEGLDEEAAWRAITINPATFIGVADRVGSLEVGKDGDVVIWSANPLKIIGASALVTVIDGKVVHRA